MQAFPDPGPLPGEHTAPDSDAAAKAKGGGQVLPLDAGAQHVQNAIEGSTAVHPWPATLRLGRLRRQQRRDAGPERVGNEALVHASS